jgi:hypothetical protein
MVHILRLIAALVRWLRRSPAEREAEIVYLRQQLVVLKRTAPARLRLKAIDRLIFFCLYRLFPSLIDASIVFQPETLLRLHRRGFRLFWRWKSRRRVGRPALPADIRTSHIATIDMSVVPTIRLQAAGLSAHDLCHK